MRRFDPTEARNDILGCFGRSHRRAQRDRFTLCDLQRVQELALADCEEGKPELVGAPVLEARSWLGNLDWCVLAGG
jgi:hypothetical protein